MRAKNARQGEEPAMTGETVVERDVIVPAATGASRTPFSGSAAIAGALAAMAVAFIIMALGSGIGLPFASPYGSGPSATSLTVAAAVWLVMAQTMGFATGGVIKSSERYSTAPLCVPKTLSVLIRERIA